MKILKLISTTAYLLQKKHLLRDYAIMRRKRGVEKREGGGGHTITSWQESGVTLKSTLKRNLLETHW